MEEEQWNIWELIWEIAQTYPVMQVVGYYHVHLFNESIRTFSITITALSKDHDRWLSFSKALCDFDRDLYPGVMRDLFALPLNEKPPALRLTAGKLLWFLEQFSLLRMLPDKQDIEAHQRYRQQVAQDREERNRGIIYVT